MTDSEKVTLLNSLVDESDETVLSAFLQMAAKTVINYAFPYGDGTETVPKKYDHVQIEIAQFMLNKRGAEGESAHTENGVSRTYAGGGIPLTILRQIVPVAQVLKSGTTGATGSTGGETGNETP